MAENKETESGQEQNPNASNPSASNSKETKSKGKYFRLWINAILITAIFALANVLLSGYFFRLDLTKEKRYTLSQLTKSTADTLNAILTVKIYLEGDFHPMVKRFRDAVKTTLIEMKARNNTYLQYQFIDPSQDQELQRYLVTKGVQAIPVKYKGDAGEVSQKWIFPAAVLTYQGKEEVINLLQSDCAVSSNGVRCDYQKAESEIEYKLTSHIRRMFRNKKPIIGLLTGHGEYSQDQMQEWVLEMQKFYEIVEINVRKGQAIPPSKRQFNEDIQKKVDGDGFDVLVVAQPDSALTEREKYEIDQYVMLGGRVLWLADQTKIDEKDFQTEIATSITESRNLNLNDLFFKYGFKIESNLIQDDLAGVKAVTTSHDGRPRIIPMKWTYFPMVVNFPLYKDASTSSESDNSSSDDSTGHPIVRNVNMALLRYASSIEVVKVPNITATPFMTSSEFSRTLNNPVSINLDQTIAQPPPKKIYEGKGLKTVGLALEGRFSSVFTGREAPKDEFATQAPKAKFFNQSVTSTRMVVISDGAIVLPNHEARLGGSGMPGDNKTLLMNSLEWLINDPTYTEMRAKRPAVYALNGKRVLGNENIIRIINLSVPVLATLLLGAGLYWQRKRKNEAFKPKNTTSSAS